METTAATATTTEKVGFGTRFLAFLIDAIGTGLISSILARGDQAASTSISTLIGVVYFCYFWSSYGKGQTIGSRALNIRVVKTDGSYLDLVGAFLRYIGLIISCVVFFIGVLWVIFDAQKQGWHDKIAGTYVVKA